MNDNPDVTENSEAPKRPLDGVVRRSTLTHSTRMSLTFPDWLRQVEVEAMGSEWCIDPAWPRWGELYDKGFTVKGAVDELFKEVRKRESA